jgi:hypothetical protein
MFLNFKLEPLRIPKRLLPGERVSNSQKPGFPNNC